MAHWFGERRKRPQGGRRSTTERSGHALGPAERQPYAGAPQRGLQSPVARDPDDVACAATSTTHASAASRQPTAADQRLVVPSLLRSTRVPAVSSACSCFHLTDGSGPRGAPNSSSWCWLFLAQTFSQTPSVQSSAFRRDLCKKMKRTLSRIPSCLIVKE